MTRISKINMYESKCHILILPDSIGSLHSLTYLSVSSSQLTCLPDSIGNLPSLSILDVGYNRLTALPDSIGTLHSLALLNVSNNRLNWLIFSLAIHSKTHILSVIIGLCVMNGWPAMILKALLKYKKPQRNGFGFTITNALIWDWAASPRNKK